MSGDSSFSSRNFWEGVNGMCAGVGIMTWMRGVVGGV